MKRFRFLFFALLFSISAFSQNEKITIEPTFQPYELLDVMPAKFVRIKDGDTFIATVSFVNPNYSKKDRREFIEKRVIVRLFAEDTHELSDTIELNRKKAIEAKYYSQFLLSNKPFVVRFDHYDFFGRMVADVFFLDGTTWRGLLGQRNLLTGKYRNRNKSKQFDVLDRKKGGKKNWKTHSDDFIKQINGNK